MNDEQALLRAITENHAEDTPRLAYADWLDEHNQHERAEFIRIQCAMTHLEEDDQLRPRLRERELELVIRNR